MLITNIGLAATPNWLSIKAKRGDNISSLLSRYNLQGSRCHKNQFYELNHLRSSSLLRSGRSYKLPILRYRYNGRSIRSTINDREQKIDWKKAIKIKRFNSKLLKRGLRRTSFIDNRELWVPYKDIGCSKKLSSKRHKKKVAGTSRVRNRKYDKKRMKFPIFGSRYANVRRTSTKLRGKVFYLVGGHGGPDPGAMDTRSGHTLCEDEYGYDVTLRLARRLIANGAIVHIILRDPNDGIRDRKYLKCDRDEVYLGNKPISRSQRPRLEARADIINKLFYTYKKQGYSKKNQITLMLHIDSRHRNKQIDVFFYHAPKADRSEKIAQRLHRTFKEKYNRFQAKKSYTGTVLSRDLFMLMNLKPLAVYFELANIRNESDQKRIIFPKNRESLAKWIADGLIQHYR
jgi:N-acetylmuramoyl-L-alanine amidase